MEITDSMGTTYARAAETARKEIDQNFSCLLENNKLSYKPSEYYWQVGEIKQVQGWILHISVILNDLPSLLGLIIPELIRFKVPFKIVQNVDTAHYLQQGSLGYIHLGKLASIYPENEHDALVLAQKLISLTGNFRGPAIPTDRHLGSVVYTRYGSFNPVIIKNETGQNIKHIYDYKGILIPDPYSIPFFFPKGIAWPFEEITSASNLSKSKLLNYTFYPLYIIKSDVKGDVIKALYFKRFWQIRPCLIKQGRQWMSMDMSGRDIRDRLKWQYELYLDLCENIPLPEVFGYFYEREDCYLSMQFIHGLSLTEWIRRKFNARRWMDISIVGQIKVVELFMEILNIVQRLHEKGYIHRDITTENFLLDSSGKLFVIDLELCWSVNKGFPNPPFRLGTFGFMSPEQSRTEKPTIKEDIYAIGASMIVFFTNLVPTKFDTQAIERLKEHLYCLIGDKSLCNLIGNCLRYDPVERPPLSEIQEAAKDFRDRLEMEPLALKLAGRIEKPSEEEILRTIQLGINGLVQPNLLSFNNEWVSKIHRGEHYKGSPQQEVTLYEGWQTGMAGPLWLTALAKNAGFDTSSCETVFTGSWNYILNHYFKNANTNPPGLFNGGAGIALAMAQGLKSGLLKLESAVPLLLQCFQTISHPLTLSSGIAGQGMSLLVCAPWMEQSIVDRLLESCIDILLAAQQKDGSWNLKDMEGGRTKTLLGLNSGVSGILLFLFSYLQYFPNKKVEKAAQIGLQWVINRAFNSKGIFVSKEDGIDTISSGEGMPGILLCLIYAYRLTNVPKFKEITEINLRSLPHYPVLLDFSLESGLAGLGELFLEVANVFGSDEWQEGADWIARFFLLTYHTSGLGSRYWLVDVNDNLTADLGTGNAGILHFLIRYQSNGQVGHPLNPNHY